MTSHLPRRRAPEALRQEKLQGDRLRELGLGDFETVEHCELRQSEMLRRLHDESDVGERTLELERCSADFCPRGSCPDGCHFATRARRVQEILSAAKLFRAHPGPVWRVCIVDPQWERRLGALSTIKLSAIRQWVYRRIRSIKSSKIIAVGSFEASINLERDGARYWAGEVQLVVAGATDKELREAFRVSSRSRNLRPRQRCLMVAPIKSLGRSLGYALKRLVEERRAFTSNRTNRQATKHFPPRPGEFAEWDAFLLGLPSGARTIAVGVGKRGEKFFRRNCNEHNT